MSDKKKVTGIHGTVQNIYRIVGDNQDDIDLTREQALRTYQQLHDALFPPTKKRP